MLGHFFNLKLAALLLPHGELGHSLLVVKGAVCMLGWHISHVSPAWDGTSRRDHLDIETPNTSLISYVGHMGKQDLLPGAHTCPQALQSWDPLATWHLTMSGTPSCTAPHHAWQGELMESVALSHLAAAVHKSVGCLQCLFASPHQHRVSGASHIVRSRRWRI